MAMFLFDNSKEDDSRLYKVRESIVSSTCVARLHTICISLPYHTTISESEEANLNINGKNARYLKVNASRCYLYPLLYYRYRCWKPIKQIISSEPVFQDVNHFFVYL